MLFKPLKLKCRDAVFVWHKDLKNDNRIEIEIDFYNFGLGFNYKLGDSRRFFDLDLLFLHLWVWF